MRRTKIIATIGPASENETVLRDMMRAGMNCARLNFSHGTHEEQEKKIQKIQKVREELNLPVAILLDTKGPEIRLRDFEGGSVELKTGSQFVLTAKEIMGTEEAASISYPRLYESLKEGDILLIDDGKVSMKVTEIRGEDIVCRILIGGKVSNHKGINAPGICIDMPYISEADREDLLFGVRHQVDFIALSFVRRKDDVLQVRTLLRKHGASNIQLISKIENIEGIENIDEIIDVSDGIMVARGDMGVEIDFTKLPYIQKDIISRCYRKGKLVITATQMLESMITNAKPTRAEISDVANAVYDGSSAVMLSGESAAGRYPVESVQTMADICLETERHIDYSERYKNVFEEVDLEQEVRRTIILSAYTAAKYQKARALVIATKTGRSARLLSSVKPGSNIIACTNNKQVQRQLNLVWNITPVLTNSKEDADELIAECIKIAESLPFIHPGDSMVILGNTRIGATTDFLKIHIMQ